MAGRYDSKTTCFSPEGRLFQVEYACKAVENAGPALGVLGKDCIVLAGQQKQSGGALLDQTMQYEKTFEIDNHIAVAAAGLTSDANTLIKFLRQEAASYAYNYGEPMPVEQLVARLCDTKQGYTQFGGLRPFGVSFLFAGYDKHNKFQLYSTDPSGIYSGWKAHHIGSLNASTCNATLRQDWDENMSADATKKLVAKTLVKSMESGVPDAERLEWVVIEKPKDKVQFRRLPLDEVTQLISAAKEAEENAGNDN